MASQWLSLWVSALLLAAFLAPGCRPGAAPSGRAWLRDLRVQEPDLLLIPVGVVVAEILIVLVLSMDYSQPQPSRGDLDHLAGLKRRWAVLPGHVPGRGPHAKPRSARGGRLAAGVFAPAVGPRDTLGRLLAVKRGGAWDPRAAAHP